MAAEMRFTCRTLALLCSVLRHKVCVVYRKADMAVPSLLNLFDDLPCQLLGNRLKSL